MIRKLAALAPVAFLAAACHSNSTYLSSAEPMPYGPGVVDCSWFQRTENAYVRDRCMTPGPVADVLITHDSMARAPRGSQMVGCGEVEPIPVVVRAPASRRDPATMEPRTAAAPTRPAPASSSMRPGVAYEGGSLPEWDDPVPPPRPGAPLPPPRGTYGR